MATDLRICSPAAKLGLNFVRLGLHPGMAATHFLPKLVGDEEASRLMFTGDLIGADEALELGLVGRVDPDPLQAALELARHIAEQPPTAVRQITRTLRLSANQGLREALLNEAQSQALSYDTQSFSSQLAKVIASVRAKK